MSELFTPIHIGTLTLKNRLVMPAMHLGYARDGAVTDRLVNFYKERARGGVGLIIVGGCAVDEHGYNSMIRVDDDVFLPGLARLAAAIKENGAMAAAQLFQPGRYSNAFRKGIEPVAPSAVASKLTRRKPRELTVNEIYSMIDSFASAARRVKEAGFDALEIIGSAGYLVSQFLSPLTNLRHDEFGGDFSGRMKFAVELVENIRAAVGQGFPLIFRVSGSDFMPGGNTIKEMSEFCVRLQDVGVDAVNVTGGWHESSVPQITMGVPRGAFAYLAAQIKRDVNIPVIACNRINDPSLAERVVVDGLADMVGMARGMIADPELPSKALAGKLEDVRSCIGCNQGCLDAVFSNRSVTCAVNVRAGREEEHSLEPVLRPKNVLVVGGGPAGLEAARVAALRGHNVTLWEKNHRLGGQLNAAAVSPGRKEIGTLVNYLTGQITKLGVEVILNKEATEKNILEFNADAVIMATGASPMTPSIPFGEGAQVVQARDVLEKGISTGKRVVVVGGGDVGCETALFLAAKGTLDPQTLHFLALNDAEPWERLIELATRGVKEVTVVEMRKVPAANMGPTTRWTVLQDLRRYGVRVLTGAAVKEIQGDGVVVQTASGEEKLPADTVVLAMGAMPESELCERIKETVKEIYMVGDAVTPRKIQDAIYDGFLAGEVL